MRDKSSGIHAGPPNIEAAERALREFERKAKMADLAYIDERLRSSENGFRLALAAELFLLAMLIMAAAWLAIDITANLPHRS